MSSSSPEEAAVPLRRRDRPLRVGFLELFFDLVYIFALEQLSRYLLGHFGWAGAGQALVLLLPLWWLWTMAVWGTDELEWFRATVQILLGGVMMAILVMAVSVPRAYGTEAKLFGLLYVGINIGAGVTYALLLRPVRLHRRGERRVVWFGLAAPLWIGGAFVSGAARPLLWGLGAVIDYAGGLLGWPVPGLGRSTLSELRLSGEHASERYRQFFIIALGETILISGATYSQHGFGATRFAGLLVSFAITALFARIYIYRAGQLLDTAIVRSPELWRAGTSATHIHLVMIAGVVAAAAGDELLVAHPTGPTRPAWVVAVLGGPALFLAGRALFDHSVFARVSWTRVVGVAVLAAASPGMLHVPLLAVGGVAALVLLGVAIANAATWRRRPPATGPDRRAAPDAPGRTGR